MWVSIILRKRKIEWRKKNDGDRINIYSYSISRKRSKIDKNTNRSLKHNYSFHCLRR